MRGTARYPGIPAYPGATWTGQRREYGLRHSFWQTPDSFEDVLAYYKRVLPEQGWEYGGEFLGAGDAREQYAYRNQPGNPAFLLRVILHHDDDHTTITLEQHFLSDNRAWLAAWPTPTTIPGTNLPPTLLQRIDAAERLWQSKNIGAYEIHYHRETFGPTVSALLTIRDGRVADCKDLNPPESYIRPTEEGWPEDLPQFPTEGPTPTHGPRPTSQSAPTEQPSQQPMVFGFEPENLCDRLTEEDRLRYTMVGIFQTAREFATEADIDPDTYHPSASFDAEDGHVESIEWDALEAGSIEIRSFRALD